MADYYVDGDNGDDTTGNGSLTKPWKSISGAISILKNRNEGPGDTVYVRERSGGTGYYEEIDVDIRGTSGAYFTIENYPGESPTVDGKAGVDGLNSGLPSGALTGLSNPFTGELSTYKPLVKISGQYINWTGINVTRSLGRGIQVGNADFQPKYINITGGTVSWNRSNNIMITNSSGYTPIYVVVDGVDSYEAGTIIRSRTRGGANHPGNTTIRGSDNITIKNCIVHETWSEGIMCDGNDGDSQNCTIEDNVIYDTMHTNIYAHACTNLVVQRNYCFRSSEDGVSSNPYGPAVGIAISSQENDRRAQMDLSGCKVVNNIISYGGKIGIRGADGRPPLTNITVANNTMVGNIVGMSVNPTPGTVSDFLIQNNIFYLCDEDINGTSDAAITFDYNHWDSGGPGPAAKFQGVNDETGDPGLIDATFEPSRTNYSPQYYALASGANAIGKGANLAAEFATTPAADDGDYFATASRSAPWDMGADEQGGATAPTATANASTNSGDVPLTVNFTGSAAGGTAPYTYSWDFGDGSPTTSTQNPTHIYEEYGKFTATLTVTDDSAAALIDTDTEVIDVTTSPTTTEGAVKVEQVILDAGDASYSVSAIPKVIWFFYGGGITDTTLAADAQLGAGFYVTTGDKQYALGSCADDNASPTGSSINNVSDAAILLMNPDQTVLASGAVSSVTASTVSLTWTGTTASEKIVSWNFYGPGISNVVADSLYLGSQGSTATLDGDINHIFVPTTLRGLDHAYGNVNASIGIAKKGGSQLCLGWGGDDSSASPQQQAKMSSGKIASTPRNGREVEITLWTSTAATFTMTSGELNGHMPAMGMKIEGTETHLAIEDTPTATGNTDYLGAGFDPQVGLNILSNLTSIDTTETGDGAGVIGMLMVDSAGVDRTVIKSSLDVADGTNAPSVEKSYTDAKYALLDEDGAVIDEGAASLITNGERLNLTTAGGTAYKTIHFLVEDTSAATTGPRAAFVYSPAVINPTDTVTFTDRSQQDVTNALTGWDWDYGDGSAHGTTQNTTHAYSVAGRYTVTLEVTDAGAATDEVSVDIEVTPPTAHTIVYSVTPESGSIPLTVSLDASSSTPAGSEVFDDDATRWYVYDYGQVAGKGTDVAYVGTGITTSVVIDKAGKYLILLYMKTVSGEQIETWVDLDNWVLHAYLDPEVDFYAQHGEVAVVGEYVADFIATSNRSDMDNVTVAWDFGDTNTDSGIGMTEVTNTYAAVGVTASYDVEMTVEFPEGDEVLTKAGYITIVKTPTEPSTVPELISDVATLDVRQAMVEEHLGCMTDATWVRDGTYTNVYTTALTRTWADGYTVVVKEGGVDLTSKASIALCNGTAGSYYVAFSTPTLTVSVHASNTDNPATNSNTYSMRFT